MCVCVCPWCNSLLRKHTNRAITNKNRQDHVTSRTLSISDHAYKHQLAQLLQKKKKKDKKLDVRQQAKIDYYKSLQESRVVVNYNNTSDLTMTR